MIDTVLHWLGGEANTVALAVLSGVIGFLAKGAYDLWLARRKDRLDHLNQQLKLLYGPLYSLNQASNLAWAAFRSQVRPGKKSFFKSGDPPNAQELEAWRYWMQTVFQPVHEEMMAVITRNADLLIESELPAPLQTFCAHVAAYKVVFRRWAKDDFSEHTSVMNYPTEELSRYLEASFQTLKSEQNRLVARTARSG